MTYQLYIDEFFAVNFGMDLMLLYLLKRVLKLRTPGRRLLLSALFGGLWACLAILFRLQAEAYLYGAADRVPEAAVHGLRLFGWVLDTAVPGLVMVRLAFAPSGPAQLVRWFLLLLLEAACAGGIMEFLRPCIRPAEGLPLLAFGFLAAGTGFLLRFLWLQGWKTRQARASYCQVTLKAGGQSIAAVGYLDTGNRLYEPESGAPVNIVSDSVWKKLWRPGMEQISVPFRTVGSPWGLMEGTRIEAMEVREEDGRVRRCLAPLVARAPFPLTETGGYDMLLHEGNPWKDGQKGGNAHGD